jgi:hypothetical protein
MPSLLRAITTRMNCRTLYTASCLSKEGQIQGLWVMKDVPIIDMVHHQDVTVELSTHLLAAQREIESLRTQL